MDHVKILFEHYNTPAGEYGIESAWALPKGKNFILDNILFYAPEYSLGDVVNTENRSGELFVISLIEASGHSTVRIIVNNSDDVNDLRLSLQKMGCESEISDVPFLISVDIPPIIHYQKIKQYLDQGEAENKWSYEEACIAHSF